MKVAVFAHGLENGSFAKLATTLIPEFQKLGIETEAVVSIGQPSDFAAFDFPVHKVGSGLRSIPALVGYLLSKCDCEPAPLVLGLVLGPLVDQHFRRALLVSNGDPSIFLSRPISASLLVITAVLLIITVVPPLRRRRDEMAAE